MAAEIPIRFEWLTVGGELLRARGATRDISDHSMYCYIEHPLSAGLHVGFDILHPKELGGGEPVMFGCRGHVLRCERLGNRLGVAVSIESHELIPSSKLFRRSDRRIFPSLPVVAAYAGLHSRVRDICRLGAFIEDLHPFPVGHKIELRFQADHLKLEIVAQAIVRRVEPDRGMGVEIVAITSEADRQLREFLDRNQSSE
ncbi:MAG: PilZ domain-containing protein [Acidobacteria bacterium]|nr:PilZ domain-containing protein [Acidobacteriota bacterium]